MTTWIVFIIIIVIIIVATFSKRNLSISEKNVVKNNDFYKKLISSQDEPLKSVLLALLNLYTNNKALPWSEMKKEIGIPESVDYKNKIAINNYLGLNENDKANEFLNIFMLDISHRFTLQYSRLWHYKRGEALSKFKLILKDNEMLYEPVRRVEWHEHKTVQKVTYKTGNDWKFGSVLNSKITETVEEIKDFKIQDLGTIYLTNERLIFIGKYKNFNFSTQLSNILGLCLYQEGVLLRFVDGKVILLKFFEHDNTKIDDPDHVFITNDGLNHFIRILNRILLNTQDSDLRSYITSVAE